MFWFKKEQGTIGVRQLLRVALSMSSSFLMIFMIIAIATTNHAHAQQNVAVLSTKVDDMQASQKDLREAMSSLATTVADLRDKQNQQQGMLIGFGGLAALLQIVNTVLQVRGDKSAKG